MAESAGGAALRLKKTGTGAFDPEYSHVDAQGSLVAATNPAGTVRFREQYNPFGEERLNPASNADNTGYTGHLKDDATGLTYMQARYYDPIIGRFLSTDPIGYQDQLNLYAYVHNDPVNLIDTSGLRAVSIDIIDRRVTKIRTREYGDRLNTTVFITQQMYSYFMGEVVYVYDADPITQRYSGDAMYSQRTVDEINDLLDVIAGKGGDRLPDAVPGPPTRTEDVVDLVEDLLEGSTDVRGKRKPREDREKKNNSSSQSSGSDRILATADLGDFYAGFSVVGNGCTGRLTCGVD